MLHNTRTRSPLFYISAMGASQVQAAQRHTAVATDRKDGQDTAPPAPVTKLGIEAWLRPTPQHPNRSSIWCMTAILPSTPQQKQYLVHDRYPPRGWVGGTILARSQLSAEQSQSSSMQRMNNAVFQQSRIDRKHK